MVQHSDRRPIKDGSDGRILKLTSEQHIHLSAILTEYAKTMRAHARECDVMSYPSTNAGDLCRRWAVHARTLRAKLR